MRGANAASIRGAGRALDTAVHGAGSGNRGRAKTTTTAMKFLGVFSSQPIEIQFKPQGFLVMLSIIGLCSGHEDAF
jgi:hypothetical protein